MVLLVAICGTPSQFLVCNSLCVCCFEIQELDTSLDENWHQRLMSNLFSGFLNCNIGVIPVLTLLDRSNSFIRIHVSVTLLFSFLNL